LKYGLLFIPNHVYLLEESHKTGAFEICEKHVTRNVYTHFIGISLAKHFRKITNYYYLQLLIKTLDGAVVVSIHDRVIKIIH
jgi:hypothetical protein